MCVIHILHAFLQPILMLKSMIVTSYWRMGCRMPSHHPEMPSGLCVRNMMYLKIFATQSYSMLNCLCVCARSGDAGDLEQTGILFARDHAWNACLNESQKCLHALSDWALSIQCSWAGGRYIALNACETGLLLIVHIVLMLFAYANFASPNYIYTDLCAV